jgi:hypothetical protein
MGWVAGYYALLQRQYTSVPLVILNTSTRNSYNVSFTVLISQGLGMLLFGSTYPRMRPSSSCPAVPSYANTIAPSTIPPPSLQPRINVRAVLAGTTNPIDYSCPPESTIDSVTDGLKNKMEKHIQHIRYTTVDLSAARVIVPRMCFKTVLVYKTLILRAF